MITLDWLDHKRNSFECLLSSGLAHWIFCIDTVSIFQGNEKRTPYISAWIKFIYRSLILIFLLGSLVACSTIKAGIGLLESTDSFIPLKQDARIFYEAGSESQADQVATHLSEAVAKIEAVHYRPFSKPITIFICNTQKSFNRYTGQKNASGCVTGRARLFIAPRLFEQPQRISSVLTHELSHLHLEQQVGLLHFMGALPAWFLEGLAVMASDGGGAEDVSDKMAASYLREGKRFEAETSGSLLFKKTAHSYHLEPHMFYRQSAMFVAYLKSLDPDKFRDFLLAIEDRHDLGTSAQKYFSTTVDEIFKTFIAQATLKQEGLEAK